MEADLGAPLGQCVENRLRRSTLGSVREVSRAHGSERWRAAEDEPGGNDAVGALVVEHPPHCPCDRIAPDGRDGGQSNAPDPSQLALAGELCDA